jgi:hypothetical protein
MSEAANKRRGHGLWIEGGLVAIVLYVLSIGPTYWVFAHYPGPYVRAHVIYYPLFRVASLSVPTERALMWYLQLWLPDMTL